MRNNKELRVREKKNEKEMTASHILSQDRKEKCARAYSFFFVSHPIVVKQGGRRDSKGIEKKTFEVIIVIIIGKGKK